MLFYSDSVSCADCCIQNPWQHSSKQRLSIVPKFYSKRNRNPRSESICWIRSMILCVQRQRILLQNASWLAQKIKWCGGMKRNSVKKEKKSNEDQRSERTIERNEERSVTKMHHGRWTILPWFHSPYSNAIILYQWAHLFDMMCQMDPARKQKNGKRIKIFKQSEELNPMDWQRYG